MAKQFKVEVEVNNESNIFGAAMLVAGAFMTLGNVVTQEAQRVVAEEVPAAKAAIGDYAEMGRQAADEAAADALLSAAKKAEELAAWFLD